MMTPTPTPTLITEAGFDSVLENVRGEPVLFPPQIDAALQVFHAMFCLRHIWVHLEADMQAGKTGVMSGLIRLVLQNYRTHRLNIDKTSIFVATGMNDIAWMKQTKERMPDAVRENVYFSKNLLRISMAIEKKARTTETGLRDFIVIIDESHIAHTTGNLVTKYIYSKLAEFVPVSEWAERNIRIMTVSATDPAKSLSGAILGDTMPVSVIHLQTTPEYQSIKQLFIAKRLMWTHKYGQIGCENKPYRYLEKILEVKYSTSPKYHIIRPIAKHHAYACARLRVQYGEDSVIEYDASMKYTPRTKDTHSVYEARDINDILSEAPESHKFIILKNMFYAAQTLNDTHVGLLWDRNAGKESTHLQSLLGRACGYGKSKETIVICSSETVCDYFQLWNQLALKYEEIAEDPELVRTLKRESVVPTDDGKILPRDSVVVPIAPKGGVMKLAGTCPMKKGPCADDYEIDWIEYEDIYDVRGAYPRLKFKNMNADGFYLTSFTGEPRILTESDLEKAKGETKYIPSQMNIGDIRKKGYAIYSDPSDPSTVKFVVRIVNRVR